MAEVLLRRHLDEAGVAATVSSAGLYEGGMTATGHGVAVMADRGLDLTQHLSRQVDKDGTKTEWILTTGSANTLSSLGFGKGGPNTVVQGDVVTIAYFPARNGKPLGFIRSITLPNAKTIEFNPE